jgi:serine protease Do
MSDFDARKVHGMAPAVVCAIAVGLAASAAAAEFSARDVYRAAAPSVVMVYAQLGSSVASTGTGSIISAEGHVLTNDHVVTTEHGKPAREVSVFFMPERVTGDLKQDLQKGYRAKVLARSSKLDLALLKVDSLPGGGVTPVTFGDSDRVEIGESVAAIGHPGGGGLWTLTTGTISSARRRGDVDVFQTDTAINPGNSGGPLLDANARMIGVNTFVVRVNESGLPLEGLNYSLRANVVREWVGSQGVQVALSDRAPIVVATAPPPTRTQAAPEAAVPDEPPHAEPAPVAPEAVAPTPVQPAPPPTTAGPEPVPPPAIAEPAPAPAEPRPFTGPDGEEMFGVPNRTFTPNRALSEIQKRAVRNADDAFAELDEEEF